MKHFFENETIKKDLFIYHILGLLDSKTLNNTAFVNKHWNACARLTQKYLNLLPTIHNIPSLHEVSLDVLRLKILAGGMTNCTYQVSHKTTGQDWVLRMPGAGSSTFITRKDEAFNASHASLLGLNVPIVFFDKNDGRQITPFIKSIRPLDENALARKDLLRTIAALMRSLHTSEPFLNDFLIFERNMNFLTLLKKHAFEFPSSLEFIENHMIQLETLFKTYTIEKKPCHNDTTPLNFLLFSENACEKLHLIDWEYSGNNDFIWDLVYFSLEAKLSETQERTLLNGYFGKKQVSTSVLAWFEVYKPIISWWITLWSFLQLANKADAVDLEEYRRLGNAYYQKTCTFLESDAFKNAYTHIDEETRTCNFSGDRKFTLFSQ